MHVKRRRNNFMTCFKNLIIILYYNITCVDFYYIYREREGERLGQIALIKEMKIEKYLQISKYYM